MRRPVSPVRLCEIYRTFTIGMLRVDMTKSSTDLKDKPHRWGCYCRGWVGRGREAQALLCDSADRISIRNDMLANRLCAGSERGGGAMTPICTDHAETAPRGAGQTLYATGLSLSRISGRVALRIDIEIT